MLEVYGIGLLFLLIVALTLHLSVPLSASATETGACRSETSLQQPLSIFCVIWFTRNKLRFDNRKISLQVATSMVIAPLLSHGIFQSTPLLVMSLQSSGCLKSLLTLAKPPKSLQFIGLPLLVVGLRQIQMVQPWDALDQQVVVPYSKASLGHAVLDCFSDFYGSYDAFHAELFAAIAAIDIAFRKGWRKLWLECDSLLVVQAFSCPDIVPWNVRIRWKNCLKRVNNMTFNVSHIYREGIVVQTNLQLME